MPADDLTHLPATELAARIRDREVSPVEATNAFLERIERLDRDIHAFVLVTADRALDEARAAEDVLMRGAALGPFHGVPVSIKELTEIAGLPATSCSRAFADNIGTMTNVAVQRLFDAGAILLGKTNSPEFGLNATTEDGIFPPTRNPWDLAHSAGGSSGGAAAALAARMCPYAHGSDGGGSIRIPAAVCGVVGLKPSRGRFSGGPRLGERWAGFSTSGPMANTVADVALAMDVMAGPDVADAYPILNPPEGYSSAVGAPSPTLRIAWSAHSPAGNVDAEVAAAIEATANTLSSMGHELMEDAPDTSGMWEQFNTIVQASTGALPIDDPNLLGTNARWVFDAGQSIDLHTYLNTRDAIYSSTRRILTWFANYDLFVCPVVSRPAPRLGELLGDREEVWEKLFQYIPFTFWGNMTGQPGMSLPLAMSSAGLPIGVQLVGRPLAERTLLSVASALEEALPWRDRRPPLDLR